MVQAAAQAQAVVAAAKSRGDGLVSSFPLLLGSSNDFYFGRIVCKRSTRVCTLEV